MGAEIDQPDIEVMVRYAVSDDEYKEALAVVKKFSDSPVSSRVLRHYYTELPDAREEMVRDLRVVAEKQGVFLFGVNTTARRLLYLSSMEETILVGEWDEALNDEEMLDYFGYKSEKDFQKKLPEKFENLQTEDEFARKSGSCVVCGVSEGEMHVFGCPVEQCPWCDGQLNRCNCRFDQLGVDEIEDEEQLERFEELLEQKGRVAYQANHGLSYPTAGNDPGPDRK